MASWPDRVGETDGSNTHHTQRLHTSDSGAAWEEGEDSQGQSLVAQCNYYLVDNLAFLAHFVYFPDSLIFCFAHREGRTWCHVIVVVRTRIVDTSHKMALKN